MGSTVVACRVEAPVVVASVLHDGGAGYGGDAAGGGSNLLVDAGILICRVRFAAHLAASLPSSYSSPSVVARRERMLERALHRAVSPSVPLRSYPKSAVALHVTVIDDGDDAPAGVDGGGGDDHHHPHLLPPCVLAATLALSDAGVELYDAVTCGRVAVVAAPGGTPKNPGGNRPSSSLKTRSSGSGPGTLALVVDPTRGEERDAVSVLTVAYMGSWKEVTYWNQRGRAGADGFGGGEATILNEAIELCLDQCRALRKLVARHLRGDP
jgi:ribonuclease PH